MIHSDLLACLAGDEISVVSITGMIHSDLACVARDEISVVSTTGMIHSDLACVAGDENISGLHHRYDSF